MMNCPKPTETRSCHSEHHNPKTPMRRSRGHLLEMGWGREERDSVPDLNEGIPPSQVRPKPLVQTDRDFRVWGVVYCM